MVAFRMRDEQAVPSRNAPAALDWAVSLSDSVSFREAVADGM